MLNKILRFSINNKLVVFVMTLFLIVWGSWSATKLPIDAVPDITNNQVQVITLCPTLASQEVEQLVTFPIEQSISNIPNLEETRSISRFGLSVITLVFSENTDIYFARQLVNERLKSAEADIPKGIGIPELAPISTGLGEVYQYILHPKKGSEDKYTSKDLREMQDWIVARQLNGTKGIIEVNSFGGELKQYEVAIDPNRLKAMDISVADIVNALEKNNQNTGGAYIDKKPNAYFIRGIGLVTSLEDVRNIAINKPNQNSVIFIKDVAKVMFGSAIRYGAMTYNGEVDAVGGVVLMLKGENSNDVVSRIKEKIPTIQESLPDDVIIESYLDRTDLINRAINTVKTNLIEGALIVIFVLVLFLGNIRAGLIVASAIPLSMLFAFGMMNLFGVSANLMSLGAIDFGLVVDGAVIIVEATLHHLGLRKVGKLTQKEMDNEVFISSSKIRNSAAFGEIIILIVYIPIFTLVGVEGKMFIPMAKTVSFAILGALILSLTYIPMMCALFLNKNISHKQNISDRIINFLYEKYKYILEKAISFKYTIIGSTLILFIFSLFVFRNLGGEFIPKLQEGDLAFHCILPPGTSLNQSIETSMQASRIIKQFDEVKMVVGKTGAAEVPTDPMPPEATDIMIILKPQNEWKEQKSYDKLGDEINEALEIIPGVFFEKNQPIQMRFNELMTGIRQDVAIKIFGEDLDSLSFYADKVSKIVSNINGVNAPQVEQIKGLPQINIEYDRNRLANYGIDIQDVNDVVSTAFAGKIAGQVFENERRFDLVVRLDSMYRTSIDDVSNLVISTNTGFQIPLSQIATVNYKLGPAQISREDGKRRVVIGFNVSDRDVKSVVYDIKQELNNKVKLPLGYYFTYGGQFENLEKAINRLSIVVPISLLLIFLLLYLTFNSTKQAVLIFTAIPMSAIGGVFALLVRDMPFSISAGIGFIALFGVAVLNGIVLISTFNQLDKNGVTDVYERVFLATKERLRPVLMTAMVASLGFLPMALSTSSGAEVQKPLATVVIGGLVTATLLTLFVLPLLYIVFNSENKTSKSVVNKRFVSIIILLFISFGVHAQDQKVISLDQAISIALQNNANVKIGSLDVKSTQSLSKTSRELPKMDINAQLGQYSSAEFDQSYQIEQTIPFPTLFGAKKNLINEEIKSKEFQLETTVLELKTQVRTYFYQIQYLEHNKKQLYYLDSIYNEFIKVAELRYSKGDLNKVELSVANAKHREIILLSKQNEVYLKNAYANLQMLMNTTDLFKIHNDEEFNPIQVSLMVDSITIASHPTVKSLYQEALIAEKSIKVEKAQSLPDFTFGYTNQSMISESPQEYYNSSDRFHYVNVGVSIPISFGANKARVEALKYKQQIANENAKQQQMLLNMQYNNALLQYQQNLEEFNHYKEQSSIDIMSVAKLNYSTGQISYLEYLATLENLTDLKLKYLNSIQQVNQSVINIYSLINQ